MFRLFSDYLLQAKHLLNEFSVEGLKLQSGVSWYNCRLRFVNSEENLFLRIRNIRVDLIEQYNCCIGESTYHSVRSLSLLQTWGGKRIKPIASNQYQNLPADPRETSWRGCDQTCISLTRDHAIFQRHFWNPKLLEKFMCIGFCSIVVGSVQGTWWSETR
jgi:hypothetical protein